MLHLLLLSVLLQCADLRLLVFLPFPDDLVDPFKLEFANGNIQKHQNDGNNNQYHSWVEGLAQRLSKASEHLNRISDLYSAACSRDPSSASAERVSYSLEYENVL